jgi:hypothetical protein
LLARHTAAGVLIRMSLTQHKQQKCSVCSNVTCTAVPLDAGSCICHRNRVTEIRVTETGVNPTP